MVHGGARTMHLQLNEESLWAGAPIDRDRDGAHEAYARATELCLEGKLAEAQDPLALLREKQRQLEARRAAQGLDPTPAPGGGVELLR